MTEYDLRLKLIGQINVVLERLATLEESLIAKPLGDQYRDEQTTDAIGNLSVQTGALMGILTQYTDTAKR